MDGTKLMKLTKQKLHKLIQEVLTGEQVAKLANLFLSQQMKNIRQAAELADAIYNNEIDNFWYQENKIFGQFRVSINFFKDAVELYSAIKERYSEVSDERITVEFNDNLDDVKEGYSPQGSLTIIFSDQFNEQWYER